MVDQWTELKWKVTILLHIFFCEGACNAVEDVMLRVGMRVKV